MGEIRNKRYNQMIEAKCHIYHFHLSQLIGICKTQLGIDDQVLVKLVKNPGYHRPSISAKGCGLAWIDILSLTILLSMRPVSWD